MERFQCHAPHALCSFLLVIFISGNLLACLNKHLNKTCLIKLYYIANKKTEDPETAAACDIEYLYGYSYPFNMTTSGLNTWEISYFHDFNDIIEVNGYCIGATLLNILKHLEKNPVLSEITEKNDITLKCNGCTDDIKDTIGLLPFFYKLPEYRPA